MNISIQKASIGKRIIAAIFDGILLSILAVALATLLSFAFGYDGYMDTVNGAYAQYEQEYGIKFNITAEEYEKLSDEQKAKYEEANKALSENQEVVYAYNMLINLTMLILTFSVLIAVAAVEFAVPLMFGNGQTLGKKIFGIAVIHNETIKASNVQLFIRAVLGKFALELMIPLSIVIMIFFGTIGVICIPILLILLAVQLICFFTSHTHALLHDTLAGTVAVDLASQRIFEDREKLLEYKKALHAEEVAKSTY